MNVDTMAGLDLQTSLYFRRTDVEPSELLRGIIKQSGVSPSQLSQDLGKNKAYINGIYSRHYPIPPEFEFYEDFQKLTEAPNEIIAELLRTHKSPRFLKSEDQNHMDIVSRIFGGLIRFHRQKAHLSQGALAKKVGVDRSYISRVEQGNRPPSVNNYFYDQLPEVLGLTEQEYALMLLSGLPPRWLVPNLYYALESRPGGTITICPNGHVREIDYYLDQRAYTLEERAFVNQTVAGIMNLHYTEKVENPKRVLAGVGVKYLRIIPC